MISPEHSSILHHGVQQIIIHAYIKIHGKPLEQVNSFVYPGSVFISDGRCEKEVKRRIGIAKTAFTYIKKVLCGRNISMPVRLRILKCYIWSTLLYECETWTLSKEIIKKLGGSRTLVPKKNVENTLD